jgi:hypothetical protein
VIILWACLGLVLVHSVLPGSDLRRLGRLRWRHTWLVWLALADQVLVISVLPDGHGVSEAAHLGSYLLAGLFVVLNHRSAGTLVIGAGGLLNLVAITANGGVMPASRAALKASGWQPAPGHFANSALVANPRLGFLGDVFATPTWLPVHSVFSVGDVVIVAGVALFLQETCRADRGRVPAVVAPAPTDRPAAGQTPQ